MTTMTSRTMTGHFAMFQTVRNTPPSPRTPPTASATGPLITSIAASSATMTTESSVTPSMVPRSLTKPRPSSIS